MDQLRVIVGHTLSYTTGADTYFSQGKAHAQSKYPHHTPAQFQGAGRNPDTGYQLRAGDTFF
jgi:hypothetical protein